MVSVFWDKVTTLVFVQENDSGLSTSRHLRCIRSHLGDGSLLPGKHGVTYLLQLGGPFSHSIDMVFDSFQVNGMALPAMLGAPGERTQCLCLEPEPRSFLLDLGEER